MWLFLWLGEILNLNVNSTIEVGEGGAIEHSPRVGKMYFWAIRLG